MEFLIAYLPGLNEPDDIYSEVRKATLFDSDNSVIGKNLSSLSKKITWQ